MDSKFYVSREAAMLLKEKGYNEKCTFVYTDISNGSDINGRIVFNSNDYPVGIYPCPTKAEVIDWLESKGIVVQTIPSTPNIWRWRMSSMKYIPYDDNTEDSEILYSTRLEAEDGAIIIACKLLENGN